MPGDKPRLVALAIIRAAYHKDVDTCVLLWRDTDNKEAVAAALASTGAALLNELRIFLDVDPDEALDRVVRHEVVGS